MPSASTNSTAIVQAHLTFCRSCKTQMMMNCFFHMLFSAGKKWQCRPFNNMTCMKSPPTSPHISTRHIAGHFLSSFKAVSQMFPLLANVAKNAPRMLMIALKKTSRVCTVVLYTSNLRKAGYVALGMPMGIRQQNGLLCCANCENEWGARRPS